jgi:2-polyprenyl-3-methyl-5-hydroxy-6-metoxy-1,4-benzoquinol methylase
METNQEKLYKDYFRHRNIEDDHYKDYKLPPFFLKHIPADREIRILDIGCGFGQMLMSLRNNGYKNLKGLDILQNAVDYCVKNGLDVEKISNIADYNPSEAEKYDLVIMSHVLEHIPKEHTIDTLFHIKSNLLNATGQLFLFVPNGQSNTGAYWMYEDFTHYTLFTSGSLLYVLKASGYTDIQFVDKDGLETATTWYGRLIRWTFLKIYNLKIDFWNKITLSSFHRESPRIFTFELKALAR